MARFRPSRLFRRFSQRDTSPPRARETSAPSTPSDSPSRRVQPSASASTSPRALRKSSSAPKLRKRLRPSTRGSDVPEVPALRKEQFGDSLVVPGAEEKIGEEGFSVRRSGSETLGKPSPSSDGSEWASEVSKEIEVYAEDVRVEDKDSLQRRPEVEVEAASSEVEASEQEQTHDDQQSVPEDSVPIETPQKSTDKLIRRPSIVDSANAKVVRTLLDLPSRPKRTLSDNSALPTTATTDYFHDIRDMAAVLHRKVWVKRPGASATLVQIREDDLVDDVRDMILRKYANSLGKTFDAPDMTLSIASRAEHGHHKQDRVLGPEEEMCRTIDSYYPGGQNVDEALIINVPQRRTPRPSPRAFNQMSYADLDSYRPLENGNDYFPPMPAVIPPTNPQTTGSHESRSSGHHHASVSTAVPEQHPRSISVLNTGQIPPLPSPGANSRRHQHRPKYHRQPTSSPVLTSHPALGAVAVNAAPISAQPSHLPHRQSTRPRVDSMSSNANGLAPIPPPLPTPPAPEAAPTSKNPGSAPPTPSAIIPPTTIRPGRPKKPRKPDVKTSSTSRTRRDIDPNYPTISSMLDATVPPISVLIVEDNIINLKILEGLMKRLKVRWQTAMNGKIAVDKWRLGGFHLVLMDIQMPVMSGLQAAKEIRRLERVNGIGVFGEVQSPNTGAESDRIGPDAPQSTDQADSTSPPSLKPAESTDKLPTTGEGMFKSPVIIVALTASSLQSDRHEALAAGCNDFLTKPVNFVWLERKVKEWGCMQALIDFDGWKKWKDFAAEQEAGKTEEEKAKEKEKAEKERVRAEKMAKLQEKQAKLKEEKEKEKKKRQSLGASELPTPVAEEGEGDEQAVVSPTLKSGVEVLGEAKFDL